MPFAGADLLNYADFVFVDFLFSKQNRGAIYNHNVFNLLNNMAYSCMFNCEKSSTTVENAIYNFVLSKRTRSWGYSEEAPESGLSLKGWVFVKAYDYNKISSYTIGKLNDFGMITTKVNKDWIVISNKNNTDSIPIQGKNITELNNHNLFIFSIYKTIDVETTEFAQLWEQYAPIH
jgi:hypothetical protein